MFSKIVYEIWMCLVGLYTVDSILASSRKLDIKRKKIQELLPILILVLNNTCRYSLDHKFKGMGEGGGFLGLSNGYAWNLKIHEGSAVGFELRDPCNPGPEQGSFFSYEFKKPLKLQYEEAGIVYSRLDGLINLLIEKIPEFRYQLKHFVKAHKTT